MTTVPADNDIRPEDQAWLQEQVAGLTFGRIIKAHRLCDDLTQEDVAAKLGVSKQLLSAYENSRKLPSIRKAYEIAEALGMLPSTAILTLINEQLESDHIPYRVTNLADSPAGKKKRAQGKRGRPVKSSDQNKLA